ncbi:MAG: FkbM family methyltransferase, partial [archaeon]|nr:FkbM family methyltransferase [archaeon]
MGIKDIVKNLALKAGYRILKYNPSQIGACPFSDMKRFMEDKENLLIFDVGANAGQSVIKFKSIFPHSIIHAFEPGQKAFNQLRKNTAGREEVFIWNEALGSSAGNREFYENSQTEMSSFLELSKNGWG